MFELEKASARRIGIKKLKEYQAEKRVNRFGAKPFLLEVFNDGIDTLFKILQEAYAERDLQTSGDGEDNESAPVKNGAP